MGKGIVGSPTNIHKIPKNKGEDWVKPYRFTEEYKNGGKYKYHHAKRKKNGFDTVWKGWKKYKQGETE